jgi:hypothetical protein
MIITIIVLIIITIIIAAVSAGIFIFLHMERRKLEELEQKSQEYIERQKSAVWGKATVINSRGGISGDTGSGALIDLTLEVTPQEGSTYRAHSTWLVDITALGFVQQGQEISIKIDAKDPKIIYPNAPWAKYIV